jgi:hypothetical protein
LDRGKLLVLLQDLKTGKIEVPEAMEALRALPYEDLGFAKLDTHRELRTGFPEVVLCRGKTVEQVTEIVERLSSRSSLVMATKASREVYEAVRKTREDAVYHEPAGILLVGQPRRKETEKAILVITAGTSDLPIAEEAAITAEVMGNTVERLYDVGVAGVHRLLDSKEELFRASVIVVVAGMEGALASLVAGLVDKPVVAVPTSVGYGASFNGLAALLAMLNCCAPGMVVVNIDNGFGAGYFASMVNQMGEGNEDRLL